MPPPTPPRAARPPLFYGWVVVAATAVMYCLGFGSHAAFGALFTALQADFAASRGEVALVYSLTAFLYFGLGAVSGAVADRIGARRVVVAGMLLVGAGLAIASRAQALWQVYLTFSLGVGLGVGCAYVPSLGAIQRWFVRRRGLASGFAVGGIGVGTLVMPPFVSLLVAAGGWRMACLVLGVLTLTAGVGAALLVEDSPARRGLRPDGDPADSQPPRPVAANAPAREPSVGDHLRSPAFRGLYLAGFLASVGVFVPIAHLPPFAQDHGLSRETGALLVGLIGAGSTAGRFVLGGSADRFGRRRALAATSVAMAGAQLWWIASAEFWALALFAVVFGAAYGGFVALIPALTVDYFGGRSAGTVIGVLYTTFAFGSSIGPTLAGYTYDLVGSYAPTILLGAACAAASAACLLRLREPERP